MVYSFGSYVFYVGDVEYDGFKEAAEILVRKIKAFKNWLDKNQKF